MSCSEKEADEVDSESFSGLDSEAEINDSENELNKPLNGEIDLERKYASGDQSLAHVSYAHGDLERKYANGDQPLASH